MPAAQIQPTFLTFLPFTVHNLYLNSAVLPALLQSAYRSPGLKDLLRAGRAITSGTKEKKNSL